MLASIWSTVLVFTGCPALLEPDVAPLEIAELSVADEVATTGVEEVAALVTDTSVELLPLGWLTAAVFDYHLPTPLHSRWSQLKSRRW